MHSLGIRFVTGHELCMMATLSLAGPVKVIGQYFILFCSLCPLECREIFSQALQLHGGGGGTCLCC